MSRRNLATRNVAQPCVLHWSRDARFFLVASDSLALRRTLLSYATSGTLAECLALVHVAGSSLQHLQETFPTQPQLLLNAFALAGVGL